MNLLDRSEEKELPDRLPGRAQEHKQKTEKKETAKLEVSYLQPYAVEDMIQRWRTHR